MVRDALWPKATALIRAGDWKREYNDTERARVRRNTERACVRRNTERVHVHNDTIRRSIAAQEKRRQCIGSARGERVANTCH